MGADKVDALVLAPDSYYARFDLKAIGARLDQELALLGRGDGVELRFGFQSFFDTLAQLPVTDEAVAMLLERRRPL
jgi:hypothetical protein